MHKEDTLYIHIQNGRYGKKRKNYKKQLIFLKKLKNTHKI